ncbi:MAG: NAD(P)/FAD-dependent oxidoreductase [Pseudomonadaceae bacterium]|nr:NAD(P)/FAD-dependent oxidoreductase [Pseudomonadaceae bacterium]
MAISSQVSAERVDETLRPIDLDDRGIEAMLEAADIPALVLALVHMTGDLGLIRGDIRPLMEFLNPDDGLTDEQRERVKAQAAAVLAQHRDAPGAFYMPSDAELREMLSFLVGKPVPDEYAEFLTSELSLHGEDPYAQPDVEAVSASQRANYRVLVIGAGMSGLLSAIRLKEAGIGFDVVEKNDDVGGTWHENTYPGCRVDSANHVYSYSFKPKDWPQHFSNQKVLKQYFSETADEYGLREHIEFQTEVLSARFDEGSGQWQVTTRNARGETSTRNADAIISAVGQLNQPQYPDLPGLDSFKGPAFHSARWQHQVDLSGKRIGVIGTGGSAFQFVPHIAELAESVSVFQRTAPWIVANEDYFKEVPTEKHWLLRHVPFYAKWFRFSMFWRTAEGLLEAVTADEGWNRPEESVGEANQMFRDALIENLEMQLGDRPDLLEKCTPDYPPGAKRALIDDGKYLASLKRDNVHLLTDSIDSITENGIRLKSGEEHEFDVLIYGTGFKASSFLHPMSITGLGDKDLQESWAGEPRAHKGVTIPGFPNFYCCYGPNTNIVVNGSIVFFSECEVRYILGCLALSMSNDGKALNVRRDVHDRYNEWIDEGNAGMSWGQSGVNTWYKNASGRITQNWPFTLLEFWQQTRAPDAEDFELV